MKFISTAVYTLFIVILLAVAGLFLASMLPIPGNIEVKIVKSGSMEPTIPTGSLVVVKPETLYGIGNVITFGADTKTEIPTTHRIIESRLENGQTVYTTKGDANEEADPQAVSSREVIGRVVLSIPYAGFILDFARQPIGFALLIGVPAALIIFEEAFAIYREVRKVMRRSRRGGDEDEQSGGGMQYEQPRLVYARKRTMDEIFVPMHLVVEASAARVREYKDRYLMASFACLFCVSVAFSGAIAEKTVAYQNDIETAIGNFLSAGVWGIVQVEAQTFSLFAELSEDEGAVLGANDEEPEDQVSEEPTEPEETEIGEASGDSIVEDAGSEPEPQLPVESEDSLAGQAEPAPESPVEQTQEPASEPPPTESTPTPSEDQPAAE